MDNILKEWKDALSDFKGSVEKDLQEIRKHKDEIRKMRAQLLDHYWGCKFIRDDSRLVLSAPEIIIGDVDSSGEVIGSGASVVILRGRNIKLNGIGSGGVVETHAPKILQIAENTGSDGEENVVEGISEIVSQAKNIIIQANDDGDTFSTSLKSEIAGGIRIQADNTISLECAPEADDKKKEISNRTSGLNKYKTNIKADVDASKKRFEDLIKKLEDVINEHSKLFDSEEDARSNISDILEKNSEINKLTPDIIDSFQQYSRNISRLAEVTRKISSLKKESDNLKTGKDYKEKALGSLVRIASERINIISTDAENNLRDNAGAGINLVGNSIKLSSVEKDGSLKKTGNINLQAMNLNLSTQDMKNAKYDKSGMTAGDYEAKGVVNISSKDIRLESVDYQVKDSKMEEKALVKDGQLTVRVEKFIADTCDTEGKASGEISMNSKSLNIKSMDLDKEKRTDKSLAQGSSMLLLSEKMFIGSKDKDTESKLIQTSSETVGTFAKTTFEVQQGEKKGVLQMDGGKVEISGDKLGLYGETTVNAKTSFKAEIDAPKAVIDSLQAKSQFKSPNISDGMATGGGGGGGSLSPKLNKEDAPKQESSNN